MELVSKAHIYYYPFLGFKHFIACIKDISSKFLSFFK